MNELMPLGATALTRLCANGACTSAGMLCPIEPAGNPHQVRCSALFHTCFCHSSVTNTQQLSASDPTQPPLWSLPSNKARTSIAPALANLLTLSVVAMDPLPHAGCWTGTDTGGTITSAQQTRCVRPTRLPTSTYYYVPSAQHVVHYATLPSPCLLTLSRTCLVPPRSRGPGVTPLIPAPLQQSKFTSNNTWGAARQSDTTSVGPSRRPRRRPRRL